MVFRRKGKSAPETVQRPKGARHGKLQSKKKRNIIIIILAFLLIAGGAALYFFYKDKIIDINTFFDPSAQTGNLPSKTTEEIQADLNKVVQEGMFNISISSKVVMEKGTDEALVNIENIAANHHYMKATITEDSSGEVIYESGGLKTGQFIEKVRFNKALTPGEHICTAVFNAYNSDDLSAAGQASAKVRIIVKQ